MTTVIVADDTADICALVQTVLARDGIRVLTATDGAVALELIFRERPDGVLLDIAMPLLDGMEVLARLAADPALSQIPVMILTANSQAENVGRALQLGARDFVVKPFDPKILRERVRRLLAARATAPAPAAVDETIVPPELRITPKVLVVDDHPETIDMARQILRSRFEVVIAQTGAGALAAAAHQQPDVILMDLSMPLMDGQEALQRVRELPQMAGAKVLAMVLKSPEEQLSRGFDGAVVKPLQRVELLDAVSEALGMSGLFSFVTEDDLVVLRVHPSRLWEGPRDDPAFTALGRVDGRQGHRRDLDPLHDQAERAFARMIETGRTRLIVDLGELTDLYDHHLRAVMTVVRTVVERAQECRIHAKLVAPRPIHTGVAALVADLSVEVCWGFADALHALRRTPAPRPAAKQAFS